MVLDDNDTNRRTVLRAAGGAAAASGLAGVASASDPNVRVNVGYSSDRGKRAAVDTASEVHREFNFDAVTVTVARQAIRGLRKRSDVRYVEEDGTMEALGQTLPWGQDRIDSDVAHANGDTAAGVDVAIIDTGIDSDHPDLTANVGAGKAFVTCDTKGGCRYGRKPADNTCYESWDDDNEHGTHCAGIADAVNNSEGVVGVGTEATLHAVKVLDHCGSGTYSDISAGVQYVADQGWDVGSMSLGGSSSSSTLRDACQYAVDKGVFLVAAAGNSGPCTDCVGYPAAYDTVMAVGATTPSDSLSNYSSTGPEVEIAAPGGANDGVDSTSIYSSIPSGYAYLNGTSMACPHVAGAASQLAAKGYTNTEIRSQLKSTAEDIGLGANESGSGLVDVAAALGYDSSDN